jgi:hypothetical protein
MNYWLKDQTLSKALDVGHIQIQTTFYKNKSKKMLSFLAVNISGTEINFYRQ